MKFIKKLFKKSNSEPIEDHSEDQNAQIPTYYEFNVGQRVKTPLGKGRVHKIYTDYCIVKIKGHRFEISKENIQPRAKELENA